MISMIWIMSLKLRENGGELVVRALWTSKMLGLNRIGQVDLG